MTYPLELTRFMSGDKGHVGEAGLGDKEVEGQGAGLGQL